MAKRKELELNSSELNHVSGGMANPIYTEYFDAKQNALINPDTKKPFDNEKEAWEYLRANI